MREEGKRKTIFHWEKLQYMLMPERMTQQKGKHHVNEKGQMLADKWRGGFRQELRKKAGYDEHCEWITMGDFSLLLSSQKQKEYENEDG